jgi:hypothetical protein
VFPVAPFAPTGPCGPGTPGEPGAPFGPRGPIAIVWQTIFTAFLRFLAETPLRKEKTEVIALRHWACCFLFTAADEVPEAAKSSPIARAAETITPNALFPRDKTMRQRYLD